MTVVSPWPATRVFVSALLSAALLLATGCQNPLPGFPAGAASDPAAKAVVERAAEAHGGLDVYEQVDAAAVSFTGEWLGGVARFQPVLVDAWFRAVSRERYLFRSEDGEPLPHPVVAQRTTAWAGRSGSAGRGRHAGGHRVPRAERRAGGPARDRAGGHGVLGDGGPRRTACS